MICNKCGKSSDEQARFCPFCGEPVTNNFGGQPPFGNAPYNQPPYNQNPDNSAPYGQPYGGQPYNQPPYGQPFTPITWVHTALRNVLASNLFKKACIVYIIIAVLQFLSSESFPIIEALTAALMYKLHICAVKQQHPLELANTMKTLKLVTTIQYVLIWVLVVICGVCGLFLMAAYDNFVSEIPNFSSFGFTGEILEMLFSSGALFGLVFWLVAAILAVYNIFFIGNCKKCAESAVLSCETGTPMFQKLDTVTKWMYAMGIINAIGAITSVSSLFSNTFPVIISVIIFIASLVSSGLSAMFYFWLSTCLKNLHESLIYHSSQNI